MRRHLWHLAGVALLGGCSNVGGPAAESSFYLNPAAVVAGATDLGTLGGTSSYAFDINDQGVVIGASDNATGQTRAFRWTAANGMSDLGTLPGGHRSGAVRVLTSGQVVGWSEDAGGNLVPVRWTASGQIKGLSIAPLPNAPPSSGSDFNQRGEVVGTAVGAFEHGWYWSHSTGTVDLRDEIPSCLENGASAINASGLVAGTYCAPSVGWLHAFIWRRGHGYLDLGIVGNDTSNANAAALGINNVGKVAGWIDPHGRTSPLPYTWTKASGYTLLPNLPATNPNGYATALDSSGVTVGASWDEAAGGYQPVAWPTPTTLLRLNGSVPISAIATAINNRGVAVGWGSAGGSNHALLWRLADGQVEGGLIAGRVAAAMPRPAIRRPAGSGPMSCLSDPRAIVSKAGLADCVMHRM